MTDTQITLETIYTELTLFRSEVEARLNTIEAHVQRNLRMVTAVINNMARVNITAGEVEALHARQRRT